MAGITPSIFMYNTPGLLVFTLGTPWLGTLNVVPGLVPFGIFNNSVFSSGVIIGTSVPNNKSKIDNLRLK